jgi:hypothetical protein
MKKTNFIIVFLLSIFFFSSCNKPDWSIKTYNGDDFSDKTFKNHKLNAVVFLAPECPLSEAAIQELNKLQKKYFKYDYSTYVVIPGNLYTNEEVKKFIEQFQIEFPVVLDTGAVITSMLKAKTTPEVFLVTDSMKVVYQGAIDDRAFDNEFIRQDAQHNYLDSAISQYSNFKKIKVIKTNAVGCFIEL